MPKSKIKFDDNLDGEEREIEDMFARGEFISHPNLKERIKELQAIAANSIGNRRPITVRVPERDIEQLKYLAARDGLPYQTLVTSILHKYVTGRLKESD
jgi:predicted DNA binding CopG/RHH family protein